MSLRFCVSHCLSCCRCDTADEDANDGADLSWLALQLGLQATCQAVTGHTFGFWVAAASMVTSAAAL